MTTFVKLLLSKLQDNTTDIKILSLSTELHCQDVSQTVSHSIQIINILIFEFLISLDCRLNGFSSLINLINLLGRIQFACEKNSIGGRQDGRMVLKNFYHRAVNRM